jgi:hypothetical protein
MPAPRADTPLTPDQVQRATDALTSERDQLNTKAAASATAAPNGGANSAAATAKKTPATQTATQPNTQAAAPDGAQTAGAYAKP